VTAKTINKCVRVLSFGRRMFMSENKEQIEKLTRRVDELVVILNDIKEDLRQVSSSLKSLAVSQITQPPKAPSPIPVLPTPSLPGAPRVTEKVKEIEDIKMVFPEDLENLLDFEEKEEYIVIKPRQFLGSDNFSKIASAVRGLGGDYVSAGKASHFRVPKRQA
jgi:hypothetical protein